MSTFKKNVYEIVRIIPTGRVATYGQIAALADNPRGARAVGQALHYLDQNDIPWWRVVNSKGEISTNCSEHTKDIQKYFLEKEGIKIVNYKLDLKFYLFNPV